MKTFKILTFVCIILCFAFKVNAQSVSTRDIDIPWRFYIDCISENAIGTITLHLVFHYDKEGNVTKWHAQPQGGVLIGETSGTVYHTIGVTQDKIQTSLTNGAWTETYINNYIAVGVGKDAVSWGGKDTYHITLTQDGDVTALVEKYTTFCK